MCCGLYRSYTNTDIRTIRQLYVMEEMLIFVCLCSMLDWLMMSLMYFIYGLITSVFISFFFISFNMKQNPLCTLSLLFLSLEIVLLIDLHLDLCNFVRSTACTNEQRSLMELVFVCPNLIHFRTF